MTLRDLSYAILEIIRNAHIVDDERIDIRLLDQFINTKRSELISKNNMYDAHNEDLRQSMQVDLSDYSSTNAQHVLRSDNTLPTFIVDKYGPLIDEIRGLDHSAYNFTVVPFDRLRWCGNGFFNQYNIFASMHGKRLYLKSKDESFKLIGSVIIEGVFNNPLEVLDENGDLQITPESGNYPINGELFNSIKTEILKTDISFMLRQVSDEINDADGEIKE